MKLIDKDALVVEIDKKIEFLTPYLGACAGQIAAEASNKIAGYGSVKEIINSLEVKEVDLEKENVASVWHSKDDMPMAGKVIFVTYDGLDAKRIITWQKDFITIAIDKWAYVDDLLKL